jgi:hypothetical protein
MPQPLIPYAEGLQAANCNWALKPSGAVLAVNIPNFTATVASVPGLPAARSIAGAAFEDLTPALLGKLRPEIVLTPLIGCCFDAIDVAQNLSRMGYENSLIVIAEALPVPALVETEVKAVARDIDVSVALHSSAIARPA